MPRSFNRSPDASVFSRLHALPRAAALLRMVGGGLLLALGSGWGCAPEDHPAEPDPLEPAVALVSPAEGDTVLGMVPLLASVSLGEPADAVYFFVDGAAVDTLLSPPWETHWLAEAPAEGIARQLHVEALGRSCGRVSSQSIVVWAISDLAPEVTLEPTPRAIWVERRGDVRFRARAVDPEDGPLPSEKIRWYGDQLSESIIGEWLQVEVLPEREQRLTAEAVDRWGRTGAITIRIRPFHYGGVESPKACLDNVAASLRALDPQGFIAACAPDFQFWPCPPPDSLNHENPGWSFAQFEARLSAWLSDSHLAQLDWTWRLSQPAQWYEDQEYRAWVTAREITFRYQTPEGGITSEGGEAGFLLGAEQESGPWRLLSWKETADSRGARWADLLARSGEMKWGRPNRNHRLLEEQP